MYYPYVHVRDERWLKVAALYWPKIVRIVPGDYHPRDSDTARVLIDELGFIDSQPPGPSVQAVATRFLELLENYLDIQFGIAWRYSDSSISDGPWQIRGRRNSDFVPEPARGRPLAAVRASQIDPRLAARLVRHKFAIQASRDDDPWHLLAMVGSVTPRYDHRDGLWLVMDERLASVYTSVLAEDFATANRLQPTTDQLGAYTVANNWTSDRIAAALLDEPGPRAAATSGELAETLGFLALNLVVPDRLDDIPVGKIVEIRKRYGQEFLAFGQAVDQTAADLAELVGIRDQPMLDSYLKDEVANRFAQPMDDLRRQLQGLKVDAATMAINVKTVLPAGAGLVAGALLAGHPLIAGTSAAALGLMTMRRGARQQRDATLQSAPAASFLLHTQERLEARGLLDETLRRIQQITGTGTG